MSSSRLHLAPLHDLTLTRIRCAEDEKFLLTYVIFKLKLVKGKVIIFVADVERCLKLLTAEQQRLIVRVAVQEYTLAETASMLRWSLRSTQRRYHEALDELTAIFQKRGLMQQVPGISDALLKSCQEAKAAGVPVTYSE